MAVELQRIAGTRIKTVICEPHGWLFADRVKDAESAFSKLLYGRSHDLAQMRDLYAGTIVVPTRQELSGAIEALLDDMPESSVLERTAGDPSSFVYDDLHVAVRLGRHAAALGDLGQREFEVQVRTGLQFAWWRATHDAVYKGKRSRNLVRVTSQARASLEMLDLVLADLPGAAVQLQATGPDPHDVRRDRTAGLLVRWEEARRPRDVVRFCDSVNEVAAAAGLDARWCGVLLDSSGGRRLVSQLDVAPFQAVLAMLVETKGPGFIDELPKDRRLLVTDELRTACPALSGVPVGRLARL